MAKKIILIALSIVAIIVVVFGAYAALTYPRNVVSFTVSFTTGADVQRELFSTPWLNDKVLVEIDIQSGSALWGAEITSGNSTIWSHSALQGGQTIYISGWMALPPGDYNFTFRTLGLGSLQANAKVMTKGSFW